MAKYLIGDVQGCDAALGELLQHIDFSPSRDTAYLLGDLVNRGPQSAAVLRRVVALGDAAKSLLGNHDLHLLGVAHGIRQTGKKDTLGELLQAPDREALIDWLRHRAMAMWLANGEQKILMVHAGVLPQWDAPQTLALAAEVEAALRSPDIHTFLRTMYGNQPARWSDDLRGADRSRVIVNALTRLRYCSPLGEMEFAHNGALSEAPDGYLPWFDVQGRRTGDVTLAFGHWSALGFVRRPRLFGLDTACVWGSCLTALRVGEREVDNERISIPCAQIIAPGDASK